MSQISMPDTAGATLTDSPLTAAPGEQQRCHNTTSRPERAASGPALRPRMMRGGRDEH